MEQQQKDSVHEAAPLAGQGSQVTQSGESATGEGSARMNPEIKARWVAALRSGNYAQARSALRDGTGMCCLGVLCDVVDPDGWSPIDSETLKHGHRGSWGVPNYSVLQEVGLLSSMGAEVVIDGWRDWLTVHNDTGRTFAEIAHAIEEQL